MLYQPKFVLVRVYVDSNSHQRGKNVLKPVTASNRAIQLGDNNATDLVDL